MEKEKLKGKYLIYVLSRCVYPYENIPDDKTLNFEEFKRECSLMELDNNGRIKDKR